MLPNQVHAMDAARHNYAIKCIQDGYDYDLYVSFIMQAVKEEFVECMTVSPREWEFLHWNVD